MGDKSKDCNEPCIAWQHSGRTLKVTGIENKDISGSILVAVAKWRYSVLVRETIRRESIETLQTLRAITERVGMEDVTDAVSLRTFCEFYKGYSQDNPKNEKEVRMSAAEKWFFPKRKDKLNFARNVKKLNETIWKKTVLYQVGDIPMSDVVIVDVSHLTKVNFVDIDGAVGSTMYTITRNEKKGNGALSKTCLTEIKKILESDSLLEKRNDNEIAVKHLMTQMKDRNESTMNCHGMTRWTMGDSNESNAICVRNLFAPGVTDDLFQILGMVLKEYGGCEVAEKGTDKIVIYKATVLSTIHQVIQNCHRDYSLGELKKTKGKHPWSADIPLVKGGLYLNVWHGTRTDMNREYSGNQNFTIHVPYGYVLICKRCVSYLLIKHIC